MLIAKKKVQLKNKTVVGDVNLYPITDTKVVLHNGESLYDIIENIDSSGLGGLVARVDRLDASVVILDASVSGYDASMTWMNDKIEQFDVSLNLVWDIIGTYDGSIEGLAIKVDLLDASVVEMSETVSQHDASISELYSDIDNMISKTIGEAKGDLITFSAAGTPQKLGIGSAGQYLGISSGLPSWENFMIPSVVWTDGSVNGPSIVINTDGGMSIPVNVPAARNESGTYYSGIITTGSQEFKGGKIFVDDVCIGTSDITSKLFVNGEITATGDIQSTDGGVAAMGIADLSQAGGGGGTGTVQAIRLGNNTPISPTEDGLVTLPAYTITETDGYFAGSLSMNADDGLILFNKANPASALSTVSISLIRSSLGIGTPETAGGVPILDTNAKIKLANIPDVILGQVLYGGTVNASGVATLSTNAKTKLGITSNTVTLSNSAGTSSTYGWVRFEGVYFIMQDDSSFGNLGLKVGDWLISTGTSWEKIDNTDAVTGVQVNNGTIMTGNVNIPAADASNDGVITTGVQTFAGAKTFSSDVLVNRLKITNTSAVKHIEFSRSSYNYIVVPTGSHLMINIANTPGTNDSYDFDASAFKPYTSGKFSLGDSSHRWNNIYGTVLDISSTSTLSGNVTLGNNLYLGNSDQKAIYFRNSGNTANLLAIYAATDNSLVIGNGFASGGYNTIISGNNVRLRYGTSKTIGLFLNNDGNVGIGTSTTPDASLHVQGTAHITERAYLDKNTFFGVKGSPAILYMWTKNSSATEAVPVMRFSSGTSNLLIFGEGTHNIGYTTDLHGDSIQFYYGTASSYGTRGMILDSSGNVGIGVPSNTSPDAKLHVQGTAHITGNTTLGGTLSVASTSTLTGNVTIGNHLYLNNSKYIYAKSTDNTNNLILGINASTTSPSTVGCLLLGYGDVSTGGVVSCPIRIYGTNILFHYGANRTLGATLDDTGDLSVVHNIQSTSGGVSANGITDLSLSGGGGGSGTVQYLKVNSATAYTSDQDGTLSLSVALTAPDTTNALSLVIGGNNPAEKSTINVTAASLRTSLGLGSVYSHGHDEYVTSIDASSNYLTYTKGGGTPQNITVPFATKANQDGNGSVISNTYLKLTGGQITGRLDSVSFYVQKGNSIGTYEDVSVGGVTTRNTYRLIRMALGSAQSPSYGVLINELNGGWYVNAETNSFSISARGINNNESTTSTIASIASTGGLRSDGTSSAVDTLYRTTLTLGNSLTTAATNNLSHYGRIVMYGQGTGTRKYAEILPPTLSSNVTLTLPSSTGTFALTSDVSTALTGYLPLTGGTMTLENEDSLLLNTGNIGSIRVTCTNSGYSVIQFNGLVSSTNTHLGSLGFSGVDSPVFRTSSGTYRTLWHSGNTSISGETITIGSNAIKGITTDAQTFSGIKTFNDGITIPNAQYIRFVDHPAEGATAQTINAIYLGSNNYFHLGWNIARAGYNTVLSGNNVALYYGTTPSVGLYLDSSGNVGVGTSSPSSKFHVTGTTTTKTLTISSTTGEQHIKFSRTDGPSYIIVPSGTALHVNVTGASTTAGSYRFDSTSLRPGANAAYSLGISTTMWNNIFGKALSIGSSSSPLATTANIPIQIWKDLGDSKTQDITIGFLESNVASGTKTFCLYSWQATDGTPVGIGYLPMCFGASDSSAGNGLYFTGTAAYSGATNTQYWGIHTNNPLYMLHVNGSFGANTIYENGTSLSDKYLALTGGTMANTTVVTNLNADLIDGTHLGVFYKHGYAFPAGSSAKPWHLVAQFSQSVASSQINTDVTFYVSEFFSAVSYGIINVRARFVVNGTTPDFLTADWSLACNISPSNFVVTYIKSGSTITIRLYCKRSGWTSYGFRKLEEQAWGNPHNTWVCRNATGDNYTYASIPSGETQVTSVYRELDVSDLFATNNISLLNNKGIRMRTTETDTPYRTVLTMTTDNVFQVGFSGLQMEVVASQTNFNNTVSLLSHLHLGNNMQIRIYDNTAQTHNYRNVLSLNANDNLTLGYGLAANNIGLTSIYGVNVDLYAGTTKKATIDTNGVTSYGGIAAMGIADLSVS